MSSQYPTLHLTISWNNPSGEIDIHLTRELPDKTKLYGAIAKFTEASITHFLDSFGTAFETEILALVGSLMEKGRPVRPGWLGRKGYLIFWLPREEHAQWTTRFAHKYKKNKYRVYQSSIIAALSNAEEVMEHLYEPAILHEIAAHGSSGWVQALRIKGKKRRRRSIINLKPFVWPDGCVRWVAIDGFVLALRERMEAVFPLHITKSLPEILNRIFDGLRLEELGIEREKFIEA